MADRERRPRVTLEQLHTFAAVADREHVTRAAEAVHLSPGAVSQQLRLLETSLGLPLFERAGRGIRLTAVGRAVHAAARDALEAVRAVEDVAAAHRGLDVGAVIISASNVTGTHRVPGWLAEFLERHPGIEVQLRLDNMTDALAHLDAGAVDCAIVGGPLPRGAYEAVLLERDPLVLTVASTHPLAQSADPLAELTQHRYLARGTGSGTEVLAANLLGAAYRTGPTVELGQGAVRAGLLSGLGYAVMPWLMVEEDVQAGRVVVLPLPGDPVHQEFHAVRRLGPHVPAVEAFWQHLRAVAAALPPRTPAQPAAAPAGRHARGMRAGAAS